jgi:hypothetical protein
MLTSWTENLDTAFFDGVMGEKRRRRRREKEEENKRTRKKKQILGGCVLRFFHGAHGD